MKRLVAWLPLVVLVLLGGLFAGYSLHRNPQVQTQAMVGKPVPDLTLPSLDDGTMRQLHAIKGPYLVNFYASWCPPCRVEHPQLMALKAEGVTIVGIAYKDDPARTKAFLAEMGDPFAVRLVDADARAGLEFGVTGPPETYLVAADGRILAKHVGPLTPDSAEAMLAKAR